MDFFCFVFVWSLIHVMHGSLSSFYVSKALYLWFRILADIRMTIHWCVLVWNRYLKISVISIKISAIDILVCYLFLAHFFLVFYSILNFLDMFRFFFFWRQKKFTLRWIAMTKKCGVTPQHIDFFGSVAMATVTAIFNHAYIYHGMFRWQLIKIVGL